MNLFAFLYTAMCFSSKIKYMEYPICKTCIYFLPDETSSRPDEFAKCKLFGEKNIVTGEITYKYAELCRSNSNHCNITGIYHVLIQ